MNHKYLVLALLAIVIIAGCTRERPNPVPINDTPVEGSENPFVLHADYGYYEVTNSLGAGNRRFIRAASFASDKSGAIKEIDNSVIQYDQPMLVSLRAGYGTVGGHGYCMFEEKELEAWTKILKIIVERYDGDDDFGCTINNGRDCYDSGDGLYPSENLRLNIRNKPITYWQVENEWLWQLNRCPEGQEPVQYTEAELVEYLKLISGIIRANGKDAKVVMGALTGMDAVTLIDGFIPEGYIERGYTDCAYEKVSANGASPKEIQSAENFKRRVEYVLVNGAPYYDAIDFHQYENDPYTIKYKADWIRQLLRDNNIGEKELVSLENAGPYYFFPLMGEPKPEGCKTEGADPARSYSDAILSSYVIKNNVVGLSAGLTKIAWSTLAPTLSWSDNFVRTALVNEKKEKKPAFYTYKLMTEKLTGFTQVERLNDYAYKFTFKDKGPVYVLWSDTARTIDLSQYVSGNVTVTHIVTKLENNNPVYSSETVSSNAVPVSDIPVFVEGTTQTGTAGELLFAEDFELGKIGPGWTEIAMKSENSLSIVTDPVRKGSYALKVTVGPEDEVYANDARFDKERAELVRQKFEATEGRELWYAWSILLPTGYSYTYEKGSWQLMGQWHDQPEAGENPTGLSPPIRMQYRPDLGALQLIYGRIQIFDDPQQTIDVPVTLGNWTDLMFRIKFSQGNDGFAEVYSNGEYVGRVTGPNMFNDQPNYLRIGLYRGPKDGSKGQSQTNTLYYDEIRTGTTMEDVEI